MKEVLHFVHRMQEHCESQTLRFFDRELFPLLAHVTRQMAKFVGALDLTLTPVISWLHAQYEGLYMYACTLKLSLIHCMSWRKIVAD